MSLILFGMHWAQDGPKNVTPQNLFVMVLGGLVVTVFFGTHIEIMRQRFFVPIPPGAQWWRRAWIWYGRLFWVGAALAVVVVFGMAWWRLVRGA